MANSPLPSSDAVPGRPVIGFLACAAIVRRAAFLAAGGFDGRFGVGGEESLLALDLRRLGWETIYVPDVVAHHHPSPTRDPSVRNRRVVRNALWTAWLRLPVRDAVRATAGALRQSLSERDARRGLLDAVVGGRSNLRDRNVIEARLAQQWRLVNRHGSDRPGRLARATDEL